MTDEIKEEIKEEKECKCFCRSEGVRKFLIVALGTFVGMYAAMSLFAATHKPPMMKRHCMHRPPIEHRADFARGPQGDMHRVKFDKQRFERKSPFERDFQKDAPVRPEVR